MIIAQAILFVNEPCLLRRRRLDPGIEIQDVVFELDVQTLLGGPGNISLEDQAVRPLMNVDRRRIGLPRRFLPCGLSLRMGRRFAGPRPDADSNRQDWSRFIVSMLIADASRVH